MTIWNMLRTVTARSQLLINVFIAMISSNILERQYSSFNLSELLSCLSSILPALLHIFDSSSLLLSLSFTP